MGGGFNFTQPFQGYNWGGYGGYGTPYGGGYNPNAGAPQDGQNNPFRDPVAAHSFFTGNPEGSFGQFQNTLPGGFSNPYSRYLQQNYSRLYQGYQSDQVNNPYQSFGDYLSRMNPQLQSEYNNLSPMLRGESPQLAGRAQYVGF